MHIKIDIDFELPRWAKRTLVFVGVPATILLGVSALLRADPVSVPNTFADGETLSASKMNANFAALRDAINDPDPACPKGYTRDTTATTIVLCKKGVDEVVKVGTGGSAFWIDRYEASVWQNADGTGTQYGIASADCPATFPRNGQITSTTNLVYAVSKAGVPPSANLTWFQANLACRANGKRMPNGEEWLAAVVGTNDPGANNGSGGACVTNAIGPRPTGQGTICTSMWGAQDMIGNLWEWTTEWYAAPGDGSTAGAVWPDTTGTSYNGDGTGAIASSANVATIGWTAGIPAAARRGGSCNNGTFGGSFALFLGDAPSAWPADVGFRCVMPR